MNRHHGASLAVAVGAFVAVAGCGRPVLQSASPTPTPAMASAPSAATTVPQGKGRPPQPADFPAATQSIDFSGDLAGHVDTGRPMSCGSGTGPSGTIFAYGVYFQIGDASYLLSTSTYPSKAFAGPGTYEAHAWLMKAGDGGPGPTLYEGTIQLTVASDARPDSGSINGTIPRVPGPGVAGNQSVTVGGTWTCTPGQQLGPG